MANDEKTTRDGRRQALVLAVPVILVLAPIAIGFYEGCIRPVGNIGWRVLIAWFSWRCNEVSFFLVHLVPLAGAISAIVLSDGVPERYRRAWKVGAWILAVATAWSLTSTLVVGFLVALIARG